MSEEELAAAHKAVPLEYRKPATGVDRAGRPPSRFVRRLAWTGGIIFAVLFLIAFLIPLLAPERAPALRAQCASNLKNIAAALITYSNANNGRYPDTIEDLFVSSGMTSQIFVCPACTDSPAAGTVPQQVAEMQAGHHLSYIYLGKGLTADESATTVICYEPLANHKNQGMNVLFNDYHTEWLTPAEGNQLIASIVPGKPTMWPPSPKK